MWTCKPPYQFLGDKHANSTGKRNGPVLAIAVCDQSVVAVNLMDQTAN